MIYKIIGFVIGLFIRLIITYVVTSIVILVLSIVLCDFYFLIKTLQQYYTSGFLLRVNIVLYIILGLISRRNKY